MVSLCKEFWQVMLAQAVGTGVGIGFLFLPAVSVLSHYFLRRRSLAIGIAVTGSSVGGELHLVIRTQMVTDDRNRPPHHAEPAHSFSRVRTRRSIYWLSPARLPHPRQRAHPPPSPSNIKDRPKTVDEGYLLRQSILHARRRAVLRCVGHFLPDFLPPSELHTRLPSSLTARSSLSRTNSVKSSSHTLWRS